MSTTTTQRSAFAALAVARVRTGYGAGLGMVASKQASWSIRPCTFVATNGHVMHSTAPASPVSIS